MLTARSFMSISRLNPTEEGNFVQTSLLASRTEIPSKAHRIFISKCCHVVCDKKNFTAELCGIRKHFSPIDEFLNAVIYDPTRCDSFSFSIVFCFIGFSCRLRRFPISDNQLSSPGQCVRLIYIASDYLVSSMWSKRVPSKRFFFFSPTLNILKSARQNSKVANKSWNNSASKQ